MTLDKFFPLAVMALCAGAAIIYACKGDFRHFCYWSASSVITASVIF